MYATLIWYIVSSSSDRWVLTPRLRVIQIGEGDPQLAPARPREDLGGRSGGAAQTREEATSGRGHSHAGRDDKGTADSLSKASEQGRCADRCLIYYSRNPLTPIDAKPLSGAVLGRFRHDHTCEIRGVARRGEVESLTLYHKSSNHLYYVI